jgi:hypothetical protein
LKKDKREVDNESGVEEQGDEEQSSPGEKRKRVETEEGLAASAKPFKICRVAASSDINMAEGSLDDAGDLSSTERAALEDRVIGWSLQLSDRELQAVETILKGMPANRDGGGKQAEDVN